MPKPKREYKIRIEYNPDYSGYHPISVFVTASGEPAIDYHGSKLLALLNDARNFIISSEERAGT